MDVHRFVADHQGLVWSGDWDGYERAARETARPLAGAALVDGIAGIDLAPYTEALERLVARAVAQAAHESAAAAYFEYDLDDGWASGVFFCGSFEPAFVPFEEWPADFDASVAGPASPELAAAFARYGWSTSEESRATVILTAARTTAAFGRALARAGSADRPWGIGFHDQHPVVVLRDPARRLVDPAALAEGLDDLGTPAARVARELLPDAEVEASTCTVRKLQWSSKFKGARRRGWRTLGGAELLASLPDSAERRLDAAGWTSGSRRVVVLGETAVAPAHCVVFETDREASPRGALGEVDEVDDLDALSGPADEAFRAALRRRGLAGPGSG